MATATAASILIVDDDADIRMVVGEALKDAGYLPLYAASAREGLATITSQPVHAVLLDLRMPDMSGFDFLKELRESGKLANLPVLIVTGVFDIKEALTTSRLGAVDYITKPFSLPDLLGRIERKLRAAAK